MCNTYKPRLKNNEIFPYYSHITSVKFQLEEFGDFISNKVNILLYKDKTKLNLEEAKLYSLYSGHKDNIYLELNLFFEDNENSNITTFLKNLNIFLKDNTINIFLSFMNNLDYKISENHINKIKYNLENHFGLNNLKLRNILHIEQFDFYEEKEENDTESSSVEDDIKYDMLKIKDNYNHYLNNKIFDEILKTTLNMLKNDIKIILGIIRYGDIDFVDGTNDYYNLKTMYSYYDKNVFLFAYMLNSVYVKTIKEINSFLKSINSHLNILTNEEINLLCYNSIKQHLLSHN